MEPLIVAMGQPAPAGSLAVDGDPVGAAAYLSHWPGTPLPPAALVADTATGMAVRAAHDSQRWLSAYTVAVNNHLDVDGVLSLIAVCRPALAQAQAEVFMAAAEAGDFCAWTGVRAHRLMLAINQHLRATAGDDQRAAEHAVAQADRLLAATTSADPEREAQIAQIEAALPRFAQALDLSTPTLAITRWARIHGHAWDSFGAVYRLDDAPLAAIEAHMPKDRFQLLIEETTDGPICVLDAPRHSWARTSVRPTIPWPDLTALAAQLQTDERSGGRWIHGDEARKVGFTTRLSCVDDQLRPQPTSIPLATVRHAIGTTLSSPTAVPLPHV